MVVGFFAGIERPDGRYDVGTAHRRDRPVERLLRLERPLEDDRRHAVHPLTADEAHVVAAPDATVRAHPRLAVALQCV